MPFNNKQVIADRREKVSKLYLSGMPMFKVAIELDCSTSQVSRDLKWLRKQWLESSVANISEIIAKELAKIDNLEKEYWEAWQKSKEDFEKKRKKYQNRELKELINEEVIVQGDPRFLQGVERCIKRRCEVLGLDKPQKLDHTTDGKEISQSVIILPSNNREKDEE